MPAPRPTNLKQLRESGWVSKTVKNELRDNFLAALKRKDVLFPGIVGYDRTRSTQGRTEPRPSRRPARPGEFRSRLDRLVAARSSHHAGPARCHRQTDRISKGPPQRTRPEAVTALLTRETCAGQSRVGPAREACAGRPVHLENAWWAGATRASMVPPYKRSHRHRVPSVQQLAPFTKAPAFREGVPHFNVLRVQSSELDGEHPHG